MPETTELIKCQKCKTIINKPYQQFGSTDHPVCLTCFLAEYTCPTCDGEKEVDCYLCGGDGNKMHDCDCEFCTRLYEDCNECDGRGHYFCGDCNGKGLVGYPDYVRLSD